MGNSVVLPSDIVDFKVMILWKTCSCIANHKTLGALPTELTSLSIKTHDLYPLRHEGIFLTLNLIEYLYLDMEICLEKP